MGETGNYRGVKNLIKRDQENAELTAQRILKREEESIKKDGMPWGVYDSDLEHLSKDLAIILPYEEIPDKYEDKKFEFLLLNYLKNRFRDRTGDLIGLELGGPGSKFFIELNQFDSAPVFKKTFGLTLKDFRDDEAKDHDSTFNHQVVETQIFEGGKKVKGSMKKIQSQTANERPDFMLERMVGGIDSALYSPEFMYLSLNDWYKFLKPGGVMFVQLPGRFRGFSMEETQDFFHNLEQSNPDPKTCKIKYDKTSNFLMIEKNKEGILLRQKN